MLMKKKNSLKEFILEYKVKIPKQPKYLVLEAWSTVSNGIEATVQIHRIKII